jgi:hypothetical protein
MVIIYQRISLNEGTFDTNPSPITLKPTIIGGQYFWYRKSAQIYYLRKILYVNEGEDRRNH